MVAATSDGTLNGINAPKGGVCTRFNMKLQLEIHPPESKFTLAFFRHQQEFLPAFYAPCLKGDNFKVQNMTN